MKKQPLSTAPADAGARKRKPAPSSGQEQEERSVADESYLQQLEAENQRLKMAVADLTLRNQALKLVVGKKW